MTACLRCRQKKRRCDEQRPTCRLCKLAGVECVEYDRATRQQVSRSYVPELERRIAHLESRLRENAIDDTDGEGTCIQGSTAARSTSSIPSEPWSGTTPPVIPSDGSTQNTENSLDSDSRALVNRVVGLAWSGPRHDVSFPQVLLTELVHSASSLRRTRPEPVLQEATEVQSRSGTVGELQFPPNIVGDLDASAVTLPTEDAAQSLVKAYFQFANVAMPLLHEPSFRQQLDFAYRKPRTISLTETHTDSSSRIAVFFVLEVFAVALLNIQRQDPSKAPGWLADRYHRTALSALNMASLPGGVQGVQALLLVAQYSYLHPTLSDAWKTVGAALRLAVELGLHQDTTNGLDPLALDTRRRTFWVAYSMDRNLSAAMSMPSGISDGAISAKFPSEVADEFITPNGIEPTAVSESKQVALQMFRYRQIQSELRFMLWERPPPYAQINLSEWQHHMRQRIDNWYNAMPLGSNLGSYEKGVLDSFETTRHTALFNLYRPSPNNPIPSEQQAVAMAEIATNMIHLYQHLFRQKRLSLYWQSIENVFSAGTALMLAYIRSPGVQEAMTLISLESLVHTCSSLLWGMVERFPSFQGKRDAFDITAFKVLEGLKAQSCGNAGIATPNLAKDATAEEQAGRGLSAQNESLVTLGAGSRSSFAVEAEQQSWFSFLTPDDFTFHSDQEPFSLQELDVWDLIGSDAPLPGKDMNF